MNAPLFTVDRVMRYAVAASTEEALQNAIDAGIVYLNMSPVSDKAHIRPAEYPATPEVAPQPQISPEPSNELPYFAILMVDGRELSADDFVTQGGLQDDVVGIIVKTKYNSFLVSIDQWQAKWGINAILTSEHKEAEALFVDDGCKLTQRIVEAQVDEENTAAQVCWNYRRFDRQWYLPTLFESTTICRYQKQINKLLEAIGAPLLAESYHWSCVESSRYNTWNVYFSSGIINNSNKSSSSVVRAVSAF